MARVTLQDIHTTIWQDGDIAAAYIRSNYSSASNLYYIVEGFKYVDEPSTSDVTMEYIIEPLNTIPFEISGMSVRWATLLVKLGTPKTTTNGKILGIQLGEYIEERYKNLTLSEVQFTEPFTETSSRGDWHTVLVSIPFYTEA